jgi:NAD(P)-dependent dehydrogenase (short-subunit alcohol dehydrogenase family)
MIWWVLVGATVVLFLAGYRYCYGVGRRISAAGKGVVITGAASGIGLATVQELLTNPQYQGVHVYATDFNEPLLQQNLAPLQLELQRQPGSGATPTKLTLLKMDVCNEEEIRQVREQVMANGDFFALVNNAGIGTVFPPKPDHQPTPEQPRPPLIFQGVDEMKLADGYRIFDINIFGVIRCTHEFMKIIPPAGAIVSVASIAGLLSGPYFGYYALSKFAVVAYMDGLRRECHRTAMRFVTICPGFVQTPLLQFLDQIEFDPARSRHAEHATAFFNRSRQQLHPQSPQNVAVAICDQALFRDRPLPIIVVDKPFFRAFWWILRLAPTRVVDFLADLR